MDIREYLDEIRAQHGTYQASVNDGLRHRESMEAYRACREAAARLLDFLALSLELQRHVAVVFGGEVVRIGRLSRTDAAFCLNFTDAQGYPRGFSLACVEEIRVE